MRFPSISCWEQAVFPVLCGCWMLFTLVFSSSLPSICGIVSSHKGTNQYSEYPLQISRVPPLYRSLLLALCPTDTSHLGFLIFSAALPQLRDSSRFPWVPLPCAVAWDPSEVNCTALFIASSLSGISVLYGKCPVSWKLLFHIFVWWLVVIFVGSEAGSELFKVKG